MKLAGIEDHGVFDMLQLDKPVLFVDVDGVISLFGFDPSLQAVPGPLHSVDGVMHCIPGTIGRRLIRLSERFQLVWATGWEHRANEYLPTILGLPFGELPCLTFGGQAVFGSAHWKLDAMSNFAGQAPAAWVDDNIDDECRLWARNRDWPTKLVVTRPDIGLTDEHVNELLAWADAVDPDPSDAHGRSRAA